MENKEEIKCSIKCSDGYRILTFKITEQYLIEEWKSGLDSGSRYWNLKNLSPILDYYQGHSNHYESYLLYTISVFALSICIFFSSIHQYIPLLAPCFGAAGFYLLYMTVNYGKFRKWSIINNKDGSNLAFLSHSKCSEEEIQKFTECFVEMVTKANQNVE